MCHKVVLHDANLLLGNTSTARVMPFWKCWRRTKKRRKIRRMERQARATGLEPATTGSTVRYSNQLSYAPVCWSINISITHDHPERSMGGPSSKRPCKPNFTLADPNRMAVQIGADTHGRPNRGTPRCGPSSVRLGRIGQEVARQPQHWTFQKQPGSRRSPGLRPRLFTIFAKIFREHFEEYAMLK